MTGPNRRNIMLGAAASGALLAARPLRAQTATKTITTSAGTYDIPLNPQRVVVIDTRLDLEPAVILDLPIVGYSYYEIIDGWIPYTGETNFVGSPPSLEQILALEPDLIICTDIPGSEMWPIDRLGAIAPVLPVDFEMSWKDNLTRISDWMDRRPVADKFIADYETALADLRNRHAAVLDRKVAAIWASPSDSEINFLLGLNSPEVTLIGQVLDDLGGRTVSLEGLGEFANVSFENMSTHLGDVDAIVLSHYEEDDLSDLFNNPVWQRLPAVRAGRVTQVLGGYYGGGYSALHLIPTWDQVYTSLAE